MQIVTIPFHDWRKCLREGFRTRDGHFMEHLIRHPKVEKVLIINRPVTHAEMLVKRFDWKTPGNIIWHKSNVRLVQVVEKAFVLDFLSLNSFQILFLGRRGSVKRCVKGFQAAASLFFVTATPSTNSTPS